MIIDSVANGAARPLFGWISDNIGRENTMAIAFGLGAASYWLLGTLGTAPWAFVLFAALIFVTWGEIFSLFPSTCTDTFGPKFATVNLGMLDLGFFGSHRQSHKSVNWQLACCVSADRHHELSSGGTSSVHP
jgi:MFS family permease